MEDKISLKKVNIIGEMFFHIFQDDKGNEIEIETTEADYRQLGQPNPINPTREGCIWLGSKSEYKYDTPTRRIEECCYADNGNDYRIKVNGVIENCLNKSEIVDNKISKTKVNELVAKVNPLLDFNEII